MLDLNKHIVKNDDGAPFHTSGYAIAANGNRVGATSAVSFEKRQQIDQNRMRVAGYQHSVIGKTRGIFRPKTVAESDITSRPALNQNTGPVAEPRRPYNPYD